MMKWLRKLDNPFLLAAEGFLAGALLFWATSPGDAPKPPSRSSAQLEAPALPSEQL
jgi:hypothetical protein